MKELKVSFHTAHCPICWDMARRGYNDEADYWTDSFDEHEKPVIYTLIYKGKKVKEPKYEED